MKNKVKFTIYILIIVFFAAVVWIKFDYDQGITVEDNGDEQEFLMFISDNNIKKSTFSCPAKIETIIYLDNEYLLTSLGELYKIKYDSVFDNGYNCDLVNLSIKVDGFYNEQIVYDENYNFYNIENNFENYESDLNVYYTEELNNLNVINKKYPYIYFYDVEANKLNLDLDGFSNKLLIDNKGNINIYTNYGYPNAYNLLNSEDTEIIFDRLSYSGVVLSVFRSHNNELLNSYKISYLNSSMEIPKEVYGVRVITNKGMYNEVMDKECTKALCDTKLELDKEFSKYFNDIVYSNGKYIFIRNNPTTIYNIEDYVKAK